MKDESYKKIVKTFTLRLPVESLEYLINDAKKHHRNLTNQVTVILINYAKHARRTKKDLIKQIKNYN